MMNRYKVHNNCRAFRQIIRRNKEIKKDTEKKIINIFQCIPYKLKSACKIGDNGLGFFGWKSSQCKFF
jgi:hypothetical protein